MPMVGFMVQRAQSSIWGWDRMAINLEMGQVYPHFLLRLEGLCHDGLWLWQPCTVLSMVVLSRLLENVTLPLGAYPLQEGKGKGGHTL